MVERRWSVACKKANERSEDTQDANLLSSYLPTDSELADAFVERKKRFLKHENCNSSIYDAQFDNTFCTL